MANRYTKFGGSGGGPPFSGCLVEIPIGTYFLRFGCLGICGAGWSVNFDPVTGLRDDATIAGYAEMFGPYEARCTGYLISAGGDLQTWNRGGTIYANTNTVQAPQDLLRETLYTIDLRDNLLGGNSQASLIVRMRGYVIAGLAGGYTLGLEISPDFVPVLTIPAGTDASWEVEVHIGYDGWNGLPHYAARGFIDGLPVQIKAQNGSFDPTLAQSLLLTAQAVDIGDQLFSYSCVAVQENTDFCPGLS